MPRAPRSLCPTSWIAPSQYDFESQDSVLGVSSAPHLQALVLVSWLQPPIRRARAVASAAWNTAGLVSRGVTAIPHSLDDVHLAWLDDDFAWLCDTETGERALADARLRGS